METTEKGFKLENLRDGILFKAITKDGQYGVSAFVKDGKLLLGRIEYGDAKEDVQMGSVDELREGVVHHILDMYDEEGEEHEDSRVDHIGIYAELARNRSGNSKLCTPRREPLPVEFLAHSPDGRVVLMVTPYDPSRARPKASKDTDWTHDVSRFNNGMWEMSGTMFNKTKPSEVVPKIPTPAEELLAAKHFGGFEYVVVKDVLGMQAAAQEHEAEYVAEYGSKYRAQPRVDAYLPSEPDEASEAVKL